MLLLLVIHRLLILAAALQPRDRCVSLSVCVYSVYPPPSVRKVRAPEKGMRVLAALTRGASHNRPKSAMPTHTHVPHWLLLLLLVVVAVTVDHIDVERCARELLAAEV